MVLNWMTLGRGVFPKPGVLTLHCAMHCLPLGRRGLQKASGPFPQVPLTVALYPATKEFAVIKEFQKLTNFWTLSQIMTLGREGSLLKGRSVPPPLQAALQALSTALPVNQSSATIHHLTHQLVLPLSSMKIIIRGKGQDHVILCCFHSLPFEYKHFRRLSNSKM